MNRVETRVVGSLVTCFAKDVDIVVNRPGPRQDFSTEFLAMSSRAAREAALVRRRTELCEAEDTRVHVEDGHEENRHGL